MIRRGPEAHQHGNRGVHAALEQCGLRFMAGCCVILWLSFGMQVDAAFDDDFTSARAMGLGVAYSALARDGDGILINPAGIWQTPPQITATQATMLAGLDDGSSVQQQLVSYVPRHAGQSTFGLAWKRLSVSHLYTEDQLGLAFARHYTLYKGDGDERTLRFALAFGGAARVLRWDTAPTVGPDGQLIEDLEGPVRLSFDLGLLIYPSPHTPIAVVFQNLNQPDLASDLSVIEDRQPLRTRVGLSLDRENIAWALDLVFQAHQIDLRTGVEWEFLPETILLRCGVQLQNLAWGANLMLGAGYYPTPKFRLDYAFSQAILGLDTPWGSHRISAVYEF